MVNLSKGLNHQFLNQKKEKKRRRFESPKQPWPHLGRSLLLRSLPPSPPLPMATSLQISVIYPPSLAPFQTFCPPPLLRLLHTRARPPTPRRDLGLGARDAPPAARRMSSPHGGLDDQIERLMQCKPLPEPEVPTTHTACSPSAGCSFFLLLRRRSTSRCCCLFFRFGRGGCGQIWRICGPFGGDRASGCARLHFVFFLLKKKSLLGFSVFVIWWSERCVFTLRVAKRRGLHLTGLDAVR